MGQSVQNRKARYNYFFLEKFEAGIELRGSEIKSLRDGRVDIAESFAREEDNEIYLINSYFAKYSNSSYMNHEENRQRKLLLHKKEIRKIIGKLNKESLTLIPIQIYFNRKGLAKVELALSKGKKNYDKRESKKKKSWEREKRNIK
ncbi:MAG: SsrA-binding protein SmpB [Pelagibacterales bacterium]|nr:SsrA-binding protein SmpB [Pelagibacterales bacterium]